ncbi:MAG: hypothetical protein KatS3mg031_1366 [Chitinophagales bacterium]|nr:MAG: hypothetical protein KatS3mg031_1366 [Chitinophagales bacterium]
MTLTDDLRLKIARITVALVFIGIILISFNLWLTDRHYPLAPVFDFFPQIPSPYDYVQPVVLLVLLVLIIFNAAPHIVVRVFIVVFWLLVLCDQNRLQTFNYILSFLLLPFAFYRKEDSSARELILHCMRLILIGTYFWSGVQKLNIGFVDRMYPYFAGKVHIPGFEPDDLLRKYVILIIPFYEILLSFLFMIGPLRSMAVVLAAVMHLSIAVFMSPAGFGWNLVVIPWNVGLVPLVFALFWKAEFSLRELWSPRGYLLKGVVILLFIVMPVFNFFGLWDHNLSASIFSTRPKYAGVVINKELEADLPDYLRPYLRSMGDTVFIECTYWMLGELNVTPYPEERVYQKNLEYVCKFSSQQPCQARLMYY